ncbi:MAG: hypothetical protein CMJ59_12860 [Planctomycetaceae bacterium]|nr:hypothetical protein [Planctomycetaceae bacterium]
MLTPNLRQKATQPRQIVGPRDPQNRIYTMRAQRPNERRATWNRMIHGVPAAGTIARPAKLLYTREVMNPADSRAFAEPGNGLLA